ncbi:uncharacterized membrane protein [[Candida] jaroonii]|uniref:Uncharacterized membrane protein n=1 Tax=[Candida] jaroonii TaxID=467808 RepID=A0ACA9Y688_9ASCO|nr:uncharacterized membrane protein [[Candida] jaroonii]
MSLPTKSTLVAVNEPPTYEINATFDQPESTFKIVEKEIGELQDGQLLVKNLYLSNDPTQRGWITKNPNREAMYVEPIGANDIMRSYGLVEVLDSKSETHKVGDIYMGTTYWGDNVVVPALFLSLKVDKSVPLPLTAYVDWVGGTGLTAYFGLYDVAQLKKEDVLVVSGAAGATGAMVVQIAKHLIGAKKIIGIAGGQEKCDFVKSIGADECVDYRSKDFSGDMKKALGEDQECDVYFDGVGGEILDQMFSFVKRRTGVVVACGAIAGYNDSSKLWVKNWGHIITRRLNVKGFIVTDYLGEAQKAIQAIVGGVKAGKIKVDNTLHLEDLSKESEPLKQLPTIYNKLFNGEKKAGKLLTKLADPIN